VSLVVFLRGVNVGAHKRFQPALLARDLAHLGAVNVGAAGTLVIRNRVARAALKSHVLERLPFAADLMISDGRDLLRLAYPEPFDAAPTGNDLRRCVTVLARRPRGAPPLPLLFPAGRPWQLKVVALEGPFALCLWRRMGRLSVDPNAVLEKQFGVRGTTRNWNTIVRIQEVLRRSD
jgi:uncharacterized protein (DUF1697 family)